MIDGLVPYEVIDLNKTEFVLDFGSREKGQLSPAVVLLPIDVGEVVRTTRGWAQLIDGQMAVEFGTNEIVWKVKESK